MSSNVTTKIRGEHSRTHSPRLFVPGNRQRYTYVIGLDYDVKHEIEWTDAITGVLSRTHSFFDWDDTTRVRSAGGTVDLPWPWIVRLNYWHDVPFRRPVDLDDLASPQDILLRDGYTCAYCAGYADTIDHVHPESKGGTTTWGNLVAACEGCNGEKGDLLPHEYHKKALWNPRAQDLRYAGVQARVWKVLTGDTRRPDTFGL